MRISVVRLKSGDIHVNITVKAPAGGRYDTDIQKVKERYIKWRWKIVIVLLVAAALWSWWFGSLAEWPETGDFLSQAKTYIYNLFVDHSFQAPAALFILAACGKWLAYVADKKIHFECPFPECNMQVFINEPWECPKYRDDKETLPFLWHTFFDECKHKHKPTSYQCPSCKNVFELIPGGRTDKFAKLPERLQPRREVAASNVQPIHAVQTEYMPRDNNRFF
jgi:hypothetical protein